MANAVHSYGAKFQSNDNDDGSTFVDCAEVISIKGPGIKIGTVKATHLQSPNAALEKKPGMIDGGTVTAECSFTKAQLAKFYGYIRITKNWRVLAPLLAGESTPTMWGASGHITEYGNEYPDPESNSRVAMTFIIDITGKPVLTQGA
jgi:hypothetical protein